MTGLYEAYLREEGFRPTRKEEFVYFKDEGKEYIIVEHDRHPCYFHMLKYDIWDIETDEELRRAYQAANYANETPVVKIRIDEEKEVSAHIELFFESPEQFKGVFGLSLAALKEGVDCFIKRMRRSNIVLLKK